MNGEQLNRETLRKIAVECHEQLMPMIALVRALGDEARVQIHVHHMLHKDWLWRHEQSLVQKTGARYTQISFGTTPAGRAEFGLE